MRVLDPAVDVDSVRAVLAREYAYDGALKFVPIGADGWAFRAGGFWVGVRRDNQRHVRAAYEAGAELAENGATFALPLLRGHDGRVVHDAGAYPFVVAPWIDGRVLDWRTPGDGPPLRDIVQQLHAQSVEAPIPREGFELPFLVTLERAIEIARGPYVDAGPYSTRLQDVVRARSAYLDDLFTEASTVTAACRRAGEDRFVLTHSEPNGNTMRTADGRVLLFDWGTLEWGPPERDWWDFDAVPSGVAVRPEFTRFYELRWILGELAEYVARFVSPHADDEDDRLAWDGVQEYLRAR
jgi:spectinomycin phosphotransferase